MNVAKLNLCLISSHVAIGANSQLFNTESTNISINMQSHA